MPGFRNDSAACEPSKLGGGSATRVAGAARLAAALTASFLALMAWGKASPVAAQQAAEQAAPQVAQPAPQVAPATSLVWTPFTADGFDAAQRSKAPFVLSFGAKWCEPCDKMKARTYIDKAVVEAATGLRLLSVDMTKRGGYVGLVLKSFQVFGAPTTIFFGPDGKEWQRRLGFIPPDEYARLLRESWKAEKSS